MATPVPPNNTNSNESLADLQSIQSTLFDITEEYKKVNKQAGLYNFETRDAVSKTTELNRLIEHTKDMVAKIGIDVVKQSSVQILQRNLRAEIAKLSAKQADAEKNQSKLQTAQLKLLEDVEQEQKKINTEYENNFEKLVKAKKKEEEAYKNIYDFQQKGVKDAEKENKLYVIAEKRAEAFLELEKKSLSYETKLAELKDKQNKISNTQFITDKKLTQQQLSSAEQALKILNSQAQAIEEGNRRVQKGNFLKELLKRIPGLSQFADLPKHAENFGLALGGVLLVITAIVAATKAIVEAVFKVDSQITDLAKNLGISKTGATALREQFEGIAESAKVSGDNFSQLFIIATNLVGATGELNDAFHTAVIFSEQQLKDQIEMTKVMGLSVEAATDLQKIAELNGETTKQTRLDIEKQIVDLAKESGIRLNARKVLEQVAKIEGQLAVQYKNNPKLIAQAVVQAQRFGLTLEAAKKSADSLLDFETSIDAQLEAQLLTDKALNFENARELALMGDSAGAAADLLKQVGGISEYQKLNVIQQQSLAKAVGMTADELSNTLRYQQLLNNLSADQKKNLDSTLSQYKGTSQYAEKLKELQAATNADELDHNLSQISLQAQFEANMAKIRDILSSMVTPVFIQTLQSLATWFSEHLPGIISALKGIGTALFYVGKFTTLLNPYGAGKAIGLINDGVVSPQGNVVISTPKGDIIPDKIVSIIATTNPGGLLNPGSGDTAAIASRLDKLINLIEQGGNVYMDSKKVGTTQALAYSSYK